MAEVPYNQGVASVQPTTEAPNDYQRIQSSPNDFGAAPAQASQGLGQDLTKASDTFQQIQTDDALNTAMDATSKQLDQFETLNGADALKAQQPTSDAIDAAIKNARSGLMLPHQQEAFDNSMRAYRNRYVDGRMTSHADQQAKVYATGVNQGSLTTALNGVASAADDDQQVANFQEDARQAAVKNAQVKYGTSADPSVIQAAVDSADQAVVKTRAQAIAVKDPTRALAILDQNKTIVGDDYAPLADSFRARAVQQQAPGLADQYISNTVASPAPGAAPPANGNASALPLSAVTAAIHGQESNGQATSQTSVNGAMGGMQILPATFQQYAKPGEVITNPADNAAVGQRIVSDLYQKYNGDPARVAVAYFSGPNNVAPPGSPTPYIADKTDGNGQSVSGYVNQVTARAAKAGLLMDKATIFSKIDADHADNPQMAQAIKTNVAQKFAEANMAQQAQQQAQLDASNQAHTGYVRQIIGGQFTPDMLKRVASDPRLNAADIENIFDFAQKAGKDGASGDAAKYGSGYFDVLKRMNISDPNDPQRISSVSQLVSMAGESGPLNSAGLERATSVLSSLKKPENVAYAKIQEQALAHAKSVLSFSDDTGYFKVRDPKGEAAFQVGFVPAFYKAWDQAIAGGKDPTEFINSKNVDALIKPFQRTDAQLVADKQAAGENIGPDGQPASISDQSSFATQDAVRSAYLQGKFGDPSTPAARAAAADVLHKRGWAAVAPSTSTIAPPIVQ